MASSSVRVSRAYTRGGKKDAASELFDKALKVPKPSAPPPRRTSPRKQPSPPDGGAGDPFNFDCDRSPPRAVPPSGGGVRRLLVSPPNAGLEEETSSDTDELPLSQGSSTSSQGSLSGRVGAVALNSPPRPQQKAQISPKRPREDAPSSSANAAAKRSKTALFTGNQRNKAAGKSKKAVYRHQWSAVDADGKASEEIPKPVRAASSTADCKKPSAFDFDDDEAPSATARINQKAVQSKQTGARVRNVKAAHQCVESGEVQSCRDDCTYLLESLEQATTNKLKCLSVLGLAGKCVAADFRQLLRAHGAVGRFFGAAGRAWEDDALALATSCVVYLMARDRLSFAADSVALRLLVGLAQTSVAADASADYRLCHSKVWQILLGWHRQAASGAAPSNDDDDESPIAFDITEANLSAHLLSTEALVFVSARSADEKFKLEFREIGGLKQISSAMCIVSKDISDEVDLSSPQTRDRLKMMERHLRILEHMTFMSTQNQSFLIIHNNQAALTCCASFFARCVDKVSIVADESAKRLLSTCLAMVCRVLMNLSHDNELCCARLGQTSGFLERCLRFVAHLSASHADAHRFDLLVLSLGLLINLVEHCAANRRLVARCCVDVDGASAGAAEALTRLFLRHEAVAKAADAECDRNLDLDAQPTDEQIQRSIGNALEKASDHMQDSMVASYLALLVGCLAQQNSDVAQAARALLPDRRFAAMVEQLTQFLDFMKLANSAGNTGQKTIARIVDFLDKLDSADTLL